MKGDTVMYPVHKEKYIVSEKAFYHFMYDRHADVFRKEKRGHMIYAIAMVVCLVVVTVINLFNPAVKGDYVWMVLPIVFTFLAIALINKYRSADKVAYNKIMKDYEGRIMAYRSYIVDIGESGDEYIIKMALNRKNGKYSNMILVTADELPSFEAGERVMMYGTCEGMSLSTGAEGEEEDESYPCFALLLFATLEN